MQNPLREHPGKSTFSISAILIAIWTVIQLGEAPEDVQKWRGHLIWISDHITTRFVSTTLIVLAALVFFAGQVPWILSYFRRRRGPAVAVSEASPKYDTTPIGVAQTLLEMTNGVPSFGETAEWIKWVQVATARIRAALGDAEGKMFREVLDSIKESERGISRRIAIDHIRGLAGRIHDGRPILADAQTEKKSESPPNYDQLRIDAIRKKLRDFIGIIPAPPSLLMIDTGRLVADMMRGGPRDWKSEIRIYLKSVFSTESNVLRHYDDCVKAENPESNAVLFLQGIADNLTVSQLR